MELVLEDKLLDPFRPIDRRSALMDGSGVGELASTEIKPDREVTPDSLGLILKATIIGGPRGVASINGRTYLENEIVKVSDLPLEIAIFGPQNPIFFWPPKAAGPDFEPNLRISENRLPKTRGGILGRGGGYPGSNTPDAMKT